MMARDPEVYAESPVNIALEKIITAVEDARDRLRIDGGVGQYDPPWRADPWPHTPASEAEAVLTWVGDLAKAARP